MILPLLGERAGVREVVITNLVNPFPTMPLLTELGFILIARLQLCRPAGAWGFGLAGFYKYVAPPALAGVPPSFQDDFGE